MSTADVQDLPYDATISFPVIISRGEISVTYLKTYRNAGVLEIFLSSHEHTSYPSVGKPPRTGALDCCNRTKTFKLQHLKGPGLYRYPGYGTSVWLDTWDPNELTSTIQIKTYATSYRGRFQLNFAHHSLSAEERERRSGDKVKLLGVRSC